MPDLFSRSLVWLLPIAVVTAYLAPLGLWIPAALLALLAIARMWQQVGGGGFRDFFTKSALLWLVPVLALISAAWAIEPGEAVERSVRLGIELILGAAIVFAMFRTDYAARGRAFAATLWIGAVVGLALAAEFRVGAPLSQAVYGGSSSSTGQAFGRGGVFHAMILIPAIVGAWRHGNRRTAVVAGAAGIAAVLLHAVETAAVALLAGLLVGAFVLLLPKLRLLVAPVVALGILAMPALVPPVGGVAYCAAAEVSSSLTHRIHIWDFVVERIEQRPLLGWGLGASRNMPGAHRMSDLYRCSPEGDLDVVVAKGPLLPLHPHNGPLQVWLSFGAVGAVLAVLAVAWPLWRLARKVSTPGASAAAAGSATVVFIIASMSFGLWQSWFLSGIFLAVAVLIAAVAEDLAPDG